MKVAVFIFEFCCYLKDVLFKFFLSMLMFLFHERKDMYISHLKFQYQSMNLLMNSLNLFQMSGKKEKFSFSTTRWSILGSKVQWVGNLIIIFWEEKKIMESIALEKLCNKIVDVIYGTFPRKYYFIKMSQSKKQKKYIFIW